MDEAKDAGMLRTTLKNVIVLTSMSKIFSIPGSAHRFFKSLAGDYGKMSEIPGPLECEQPCPESG